MTKIVAKTNAEQKSSRLRPRLSIAGLAGSLSEPIPDCAKQYPHLRGSCLLKCGGTEELQSPDEAKTQPHEEPGTQQQHDDEVKELRKELSYSERIRMEQQRAIEKDHEAFEEARKQTRMFQEPLKGIEILRIEL